MVTVAASSHAADPLVFVSAFAAGDEGAIHAYRLNLKTGKLKLAHRTTDVEHPFFTALSPDGKFLYSIHAKQFGGKENEEVALQTAARFSAASTVTVASRGSVSRGTRGVSSATR